MNQITPDELAYVHYEAKKEFIRRNHIEYMSFLWQKKIEPFIVGKHTSIICQRIDKAIKDYKNKISTYLMIKIPFRHGKSDIVSRFLPSRFIGLFPDDEVLVVGYGQDLVRKFSRFCRNLVKSEKWNALFGHSISDELSNVDEWGLSGYLGSTQWRGFGGQITGSGGNLVIIDDFCKNREQAESEVWREKVWNGFKDDIMTRIAPVHLVIILATPWHKDDLFGRIEMQMKEDKNFPQFEEIKLPAFDDNYPSGTLFPERYDISWYHGHRAILGSYGTASLLQCDPVARGGNRFQIDKIKYVDSFEEFQEKTGVKNVRFARAWDLASSIKQTIKSDPDYTVGAKGCVGFISNGHPGLKAPVMYIDDLIRGQWESPERQERIKNAALTDGDIPIGIEAFAAYKDAYIEIRDTLKGIRTVHKLQLAGDKGVKAAPLEPIIEAGNFYLKRSDWNIALVNEMCDFPSGKHDDTVDAVACLYDMTAKRPFFCIDVDDENDGAESEKLNAVDAEIDALFGEGVIV